MLNQGLRRRLSLHNLVSQLEVAGIVGLLLAIACLKFSPLWTLIALVILVFGFAAVKRPEIALLGILIATSSIIFEDQLPLIHVGIGSLHIADVLLLGSLGLIFVRAIVEPHFKIVHTPLDWPLLGFIGLALLSTAIAILGSSVDFSLGLREFRVIAYYLTFFIVANLVREASQVRLLVRGLLFLATIVAAAMVAQFLVGDSFPLLPGRVETLQTAGVDYAGVTRILPPGQSIILVAFITTTVSLVLGQRRQSNISSFLQWGLLGLAVLLSFTRSFWVQVGIAVMILPFLISARERGRLFGFGFVVLLLVVTTLVLTFLASDSRVMQLVSASSERLATLGSGQTLDEGSLQWRYVENEYVLPQILSHPLLGLGLGARYRPTDRRIDYRGSVWDARYYIHNGHFWIMMKAGPLAYFCLMWLSVAFLIRGFKYWRLIPDLQMRGYVLGFTLAYLGVLIGAVIRPMFMQWFWTPVIGLMMGFNEVVIRESVRRK